MLNWHYLIEIFFYERWLGAFRYVDKTKIVLQTTYVSGIIEYAKYDWFMSMNVNMEFDE